MIRVISKAVGEFFVVLDQGDEDEANRTPSVPRYTPAELRYIGELATRSPEMKPEIQKIALAKRVFPGAVIRGSETEVGRRRRYVPMFGPIKPNEQYDEALAEYYARYSPENMEEVA